MVQDYGLQMRMQKYVNGKKDYHYKNTIPHNINIDSFDISENIIVNPWMIILQRSLFLKFVTEKGCILIAWLAYCVPKESNDFVWGSRQQSTTWDSFTTYSERMFSIRILSTTL